MNSARARFSSCGASLKAACQPGWQRVKPSMDCSDSENQDLDLATDFAAVVGVI